MSLGAGNLILDFIPPARAQSPSCTSPRRLFSPLSLKGKLAGELQVWQVSQAPDLPCMSVPSRSFNSSSDQNMGVSNFSGRVSARGCSLSVHRMPTTKVALTKVSVPLALLSLSLLPHHTQDLRRPSSGIDQLLPVVFREMGFQAGMIRSQDELQGYGQQYGSFL